MMLCMALSLYITAHFGPVYQRDFQCLLFPVRYLNRIITKPSVMKPAIHRQVWFRVRGRWGPNIFGDVLWRPSLTCYLMAHWQKEDLAYIPEFACHAI